MGRKVSGIGQTTGSSKLKRKIRNLERLLRLETLDANKKIECERALAANKQELAEIEANRKTKKIAQRYQMVRFFERKKSTRRLKHALRQLSENQDDEKLQNEFKEAETDFHYVREFPLDQKYESIYSEAELSEKARAVRDSVKSMIQSGKLSAGIEDGKALALESSDD